jgi:hypothetical protein
MCVVFRQDNARFDRQKFVAACRAGEPALTL